MRGRVFGFARTLACGLCAVVIVSSLGCGSGVKPPELFPVSGKVTYQGRPVPGAKLVFIPAKEDPKKPPTLRANGETDADGVYELTWGQEQIAGSPAGSFKVFIIAYQAVDATHDSETAPPSLIPEKYNSPVTSGLTAIVKEDGENVANFDL